MPTSCRAMCTSRSPAALADLIRSDALHVPHAFLTGPQSDRRDFGGMGHAAGPVFVKQVHSALVVTVDRPFAGDPPEADALVTATSDLALGIVTADCAPVLLADRAAGVVAAAHAGWRGAFGGVLEATVEQMVSLGARRENIAAVIGPTIAQSSYEVDAGFHERLIGHDAANADLFEPGGPGHYQFDLPGYVARRLTRGAGTGAVTNLALDTYTDPDRFYSFRRATHRGEPTYGRQFSIIALPSG